MCLITLATLVIGVATTLVNHRQLRLCLRATRFDAATLIVTLLATLLLPLQVAIFVGVGLSIMLYLRKAARPELIEYAFSAWQGSENPSTRGKTIADTHFFVCRTEIRALGPERADHERSP
jgi:MFS superfamily sulfate permease-like transporter